LREKDREKTIPKARRIYIKAADTYSLYLEEGVKLLCVISEPCGEIILLFTFKADSHHEIFIQRKFVPEPPFSTLGSLSLFCFSKTVNFTVKKITH